MIDQFKTLLDTRPITPGLVYIGTCLVLFLLMGIALQFLGVVGRFISWILLGFLAVWVCNGGFLLAARLMKAKW